MKNEEYLNKHFGLWTIIDFLPLNKYGRTQFLCQCSCGLQRSVSKNSLNMGRSASCGKCARGHDLTGKKFERLFVKSIAGKATNGGKRFHCVCDCGKKTIVRGSELLASKIKSCGCLGAELSSQRLITHGEFKNKKKNPLYKTWYGLRRRCFKKNDQAYPNYGGRGITVCDDWLYSKVNILGFINFLIWAKEQAEKQNISWNDILYKKNGKSRFYTLERIDNNGPYNPKNCKWATRIEQISNKRPMIKNSMYDLLLKENQKLRDRLSLYEKVEIS